MNPQNHRVLLLGAAGGIGSAIRKVLPAATA
jgi:NAD(P)-dependent dehydrogenase (short-subunit alcohol dehydrogenase family)